MPLFKPTDISRKQRPKQDSQEVRVSVLGWGATRLSVSNVHKLIHEPHEDGFPQSEVMGTHVLTDGHVPEVWAYKHQHIFDV